MPAITREIRGQLAELGIQPKKSLGQNFLINPEVYDDIISASEIKKGDNVIEVGPGLGTLTQYLVEIGANVHAVEKDRRLIGFLQEKFLENKNIVIEEGDILNFSPNSYPSIFGTSKLKAKSYYVIGNIPYYLTSHLARIIFERWPRPKKIILVIQKEVAERMTAQPPDANLLSISVQYFSEPKIVRKIGKGNFWPMPDVDSSLIVLKPKNPALSGKEQEMFFKAVRAGFSGKRKQLINTLSSGLKFSKVEVSKMLENKGVLSSRRAETLSISEWITIAQEFSRKML